MFTDLTIKFTKNLLKGTKNRDLHSDTFLKKREMKFELISKIFKVATMKKVSQFLHSSEAVDIAPTWIPQNLFIQNSFIKFKVQSS